ncbi:hypothetical protein DFH06DRAFT_1121933 [Mycena polygramma]|nr:hypothetical protein DFH06DRAFT_1121933 [Mycena polygramma]
MDRGMRRTLEIGMSLFGTYCIARWRGTLGAASSKIAGPVGEEVLAFGLDPRQDTKKNLLSPVLPPGRGDIFFTNGLSPAVLYNAVKLTEYFSIDGSFALVENDWLDLNGRFNHTPRTESPNVVWNCRLSGAVSGAGPSWTDPVEPALAIGSPEELVVGRQHRFRPILASNAMRLASAPSKLASVFLTSFADFIPHLVHQAPQWRGRLSHPRMQRDVLNMFTSSNLSLSSLIQTVRSHISFSAMPGGVYLVSKCLKVVLFDSRGNRAMLFQIGGSWTSSSELSLFLLAGPWYYHFGGV